MRRVITIVIIILICFIVGVVAFLFLPGFALPNNEVEPVKFEQKEVKIDKSKTVPFSPSESIVTNIKDSNRYLKIRVTMEIINEKHCEYFKKNDYKINDIIINVLRNMSEQELLQPDSQQKIKINIKEALSKRLNMVNLVDLYIDDFVIQ